MFHCHARVILATICLAVSFASCVASGADVAAPATQPADLSLTIYSTADPATFSPQELLAQIRNPNGQPPDMPGYGMVRQTRRVNLAAGDNRVQFDDVAAGIDPTTVTFKSLTAPNTTAVVEQNFEFDLANASKLLRKYVGRTVTLTLKDTGSGPAKTITGTLVTAPGFSQDQNDAMLLQAADGGGESYVIQTMSSVDSIRLAGANTNLIAKPTLDWTIHAEQAGEHEAQVAYQTDGLTWRADYSALVDKNDSSADLSAWVTVLNSSGKSYPNTKLKLVAGTVQRFQPQRMRAFARGGGGGGFGGNSDESFAEQAFFEYHLYTLSRPTSLPDNSTKQIELFPSRTDIPISKIYVYDGLPMNLRNAQFDSPYTNPDSGSMANQRVDIYLQTVNSEKNGLGIPLPAGRVRVYKTNEADGDREFVGEDIIQHTAKDEKVLLRLGSAFDITGEHRATDFRVDANNHQIIESFEATVRNHKTEEVSVIVREDLYRWVTWEITQSSDAWEKQDARIIHFPIKVPASGEKKITYTVKYTW